MIADSRAYTGIYPKVGVRSHANVLVQLYAPRLVVVKGIQELVLVK